MLAAFLMQEVDLLMQLIFSSHCYDSANYLTSCSKGQDPSGDLYRFPAIIKPSSGGGKEFILIPSYSITKLFCHL